MMDYTFRKTELSALKNMKQAHMSHLSAPQDGMWESFVEMADHYAILCAGDVIGYCVINGEQQLLQFYVRPEQDARPAFRRTVTELAVTGAYAATGAPSYLSVCMDMQKSVSVNTIQYCCEEDSLPAAASFAIDAHFRRLTAGELPVVAAFGARAIGADPGWLTAYFSHLIDRAELFGLWQNDRLIATGECRVSESQKPHADVGMMVSEDHRKQGLATHILRYLRRHCHHEGLRAICSTEVGNIAAQKAIERAGFVSDNRIFHITF